MRKPILRNNPSHQRKNGEAKKDSGSLRRTICNGFNQALAATAGFLRRLTYDSDQTDAADEASTIRNPFADSNMSLPPVKLPTNVHSGAIQNRKATKRIAEALGARSQYRAAQENIITGYPEARDIRPSTFGNRGLPIMRNSTFVDIKKGNRRRIESGRQKEGINSRRISNQVEEIDVRRNSVYRPSITQYRLAQANLQPVIEEDKVSNSNAVHTTSVRKRPRRRIRKYVRQGRMDWGIYEEDRSIWPFRCGKRQREVTFESLMEEPEHKIPKIAQYWVVQKADIDGENNVGQRQEERITLDWGQYELERSLWPRICVKRKRKMTLESLLEEPKQKVRRIAE